MADITDQHDQTSPTELDESQNVGNGSAATESRGVKRQRPSAGDDDDDDDEKGGRERRKIEIKFISDKSRRHITFSKRKAGIMKKVSFSSYTPIITISIIVAIKENDLERIQSNARVNAISGHSSATHYQSFAASGADPTPCRVQKPFKLPALSAWRAINLTCQSLILNLFHLGIRAFCPHGHSSPSSRRL